MIDRDCAKGDRRWHHHRGGGSSSRYSAKDIIRVVCSWDIYKRHGAGTDTSIVCVCLVYVVGRYLVGWLVMLVGVAICGSLMYCWYIYMLV